MVVGGVVGILEQIAGQDGHHVFLGIDFPCLDQFFDSGYGGGGGGFTTDAVPADNGLGVGNVLLADKIAPSLCPVHGPDRFLP